MELLRNVLVHCTCLHLASVGMLTWCVILPITIMRYACTVCGQRLHGVWSEVARGVVRGEAI